MKKSELLESIYTGAEDAYMEQKGLEDAGLDLTDFFIVNDKLKRVLLNKDLVLGMLGAGKSNLFLFLCRYASTSTEDISEKLKNVVIAELNISNTFGVAREITEMIEQAIREGDRTKIQNLLWKLLAFTALQTIYSRKGWKISSDPGVNQALIAYGLTAAPSNLADRIEHQIDLKVYQAKIPPRVTAAHPEPSAEELLRKLDEIAKANKHKIWILLDNIDDTELGIHCDTINELNLLLKVLVYEVYLKTAYLKQISLKLFSRWDLFIPLLSRNKSKIGNRHVVLRWDLEQAVRLVLKRLMSNPGIQALALGETTSGYQKEIDKLRGVPLQNLFYRIFPKRFLASSSKELYKYIGDFFLDGNKTIQPRWLIYWLGLVRDFELEETTDEEARLPLFSGAAIGKAFEDVSHYIVDAGWSYPEYISHRQILADALGARGRSNFKRAEIEALFTSPDRSLNPQGMDAVEKLCAVGLLRASGRRPKTSRSFRVPLLFRNGLKGLRKQ